MRRFLNTLALLLGSVMVLVLSVGVYLMLAPGVEILGVRYVAAVSDKDAEKNIQINEMITGNIYIFADDVPIIINYHPYTSFKIHFKQKFTGFTKSKYNLPDVKVEEDAEGNLIVKTSELKRFVWGSNKSGFELIVTLPSTYQNATVKVESEKSAVVVGSTEAVGQIGTLDIKTEGKVSFAGELVIKDLLKIKNTKSSLTIGENVAIKGNADLKTTGKSCEIENEIEGKLTFNSNGGSLTFLQAYEIDVTTNGGRVTSSSPDLSVTSNAKINSGNGKVKLQYVLGNLDITTRAGSVSIGTENGEFKGVVGSVSIKTYQGNIFLNGSYPSATTMMLETSSGDIQAVALNDVSIKTTRGNISISEVDNATIKASSGKIKLEKVFEHAKITTSSGKITVVGNSELSTFEIVGGDADVTATNLGNKTQIDTDGKIKAVFVAVSGKIEIKGKDKAVTVVIPDSVTVPPYYYNIKSTKKIATIKITGVEKEGKILTNYTSLPTGADSMLISISSRYGKINFLSASNA